MPDPIVSVRNLSKSYTLEHREPYVTLRDTLVELSKKPFSFSRRNSSRQHEEFWALRDISFDVLVGQKLGIIGRNGAGKSTLLKILSQITSPTHGEIRLAGRVASLLEVGTGFHAELTGRENIFLNGSILGMRRQEIQNKFDEIVAFAEIEKFLDTPVKRYSSGMYVRLAFAVAAHLEPEILIVDEVLAVGDVQFQKKCLGKMKDVAQQGRTVIFVSHNLAALGQLCDSCILLDHGQLITSGPTQKVIQQYLSYQTPKESVFEQGHNPAKRMNLRRVILNPDRTQMANTVNYDDDLVIRINYEVNETTPNCIVWVSLQTLEGIVPLCSSDHDLHPELAGNREIGLYQTDLCIPKKWLAPGTYDVLVGVTSNNIPAEIFDRLETVRFEVIDNGTTPRSIFRESSRSGIFMPFLDWKTERLSETVNVNTPSSL